MGSFKGELKVFNYLRGRVRECLCGKDDSIYLTVPLLKDIPLAIGDGSSFYFAAVAKRVRIRYRCELLPIRYDRRNDEYAIGISLDMSDWAFDGLIGSLIKEIEEDRAYRYVADDSMLVRTGQPVNLIIDDTREEEVLCYGAEIVYLGVVPERVIDGVDRFIPKQIHPIITYNVHNGAQWAVPRSVDTTLTSLVRYAGTGDVKEFDRYITGNIFSGNVDFCKGIIENTLCVDVDVSTLSPIKDGAKILFFRDATWEDYKDDIHISPFMG